MTAIGSVAGTGGGMRAGGSGMNMQEDSVSKNIKNQIANAQKKLQELSSDENMTPEEKRKRRQEIQQEIAALNQQLRQHQIEQRKEKQKEVSMDDTSGRSRKAAKEESMGSGLSKTGMQAMISADSSIKQAKVQGGIATKMEGRAGVLEVEIKLDKNRGGNTSHKEEELADVKEKAQAAESSQLSSLADARKTMKEAAEAERAAGSKAETAENKSKKTDKSAEGKDKEEGITENKADSDESRADKEIFTEKADGTENQAAESAVSRLAPYKSVDVRL